MAQQPNVEIGQADLPRPALEPAPARRQGPRRPGTITTPAEKPTGPAFGSPGPDTGYAMRIISSADLTLEEPAVRQVLAALMSARAAHFGRAPVAEDLEVALALAGLGRRRSEDLDTRRRRWADAVSHEPSPGRTAVAAVGKTLFMDLAHADLVVR